MKNIEAPPEILALLAAELGAGRDVVIPGLGRFSLETVHAEMEDAGSSVHITPPGRAVRFESAPTDSDGGD